jgi:hypothetical protein
MVENDSPKLPILILGTSKNHKAANLEMRSLWKHGNALLPRNSRTDNAVYVGAL